MKEREKIIVTGLVVLVLIAWLGFPFHVANRFAGSLWGGVFGVTGSLLMFVPLAYMVVKRVKRLKQFVTKYISMRTLLAWHIYAGVVGPLLVVIHSGHKYESPLGVALTAMTLLVVASGFIGRYLMIQFSKEIREKNTQLDQLKEFYDRVRNDLATRPQEATAVRFFAGFFSRLAAGLFLSETTLPRTGATTVSTPRDVVRLAEAIADVEYAIATHEKCKAWFGRWLKFHIVISFILYGLLALHVWAGIHFGLRWLDPTGTSHFSIPVRSTDSHGGSLSSSTSVSTKPVKIEDFSRHFGQLFRRYWRPAVQIHGIETTVFDYAAIAREAGQPESDFSKTVLALRQVNITELVGDNREKAFWINVYNFAAMKLAVEHYPVASITEAKIVNGDPWSVTVVRIGDMSYSLKQIENAILLKKFDDPRIVFAISCAAVSCPDRTNEVFSGEHFDSQLDSLIRGLFANRSKGLVIDRERKVVTLSWILKADQRLFGDDEQRVLRFVRQYIPPNIAAWLEQHSADVTIQYFTHDWTLNDVALAESRA